MTHDELLAELLKRQNKLEKEVKKLKKSKANNRKNVESDGCTRIKSMGDDDGCIGYKNGLSGWL